MAKYSINSIYRRAAKEEMKRQGAMRRCLRCGREFYTTPGRRFCRPCTRHNAKIYRKPSARGPDGAE